MKDCITRFKESCGKVGNMIKDFIARFKKAWAAFVRTWRFEKDAGEMTKRVRKEVEYAIDCERNSAIKENDYTLEDVPESIRHYVPKGGPDNVTPDIAQFLGFGPDLFPEYENKCMYNGLRPMACIGPGCQKIGDGNPMHCPYWIEDKEE